MKKLMFIFGTAAAGLIFVSSVFKIQELPFADILLLIGFFTLCLGFIPLLFLNKYNELQVKSYLPMYILGFVTAFVLSAGVMLQMLSMPYGIELLEVGMLLLYVAFLPFYSIYIMKKSENKSTNFAVVIFVVLLSSVLSVMYASSVSKNDLDAFALVDYSMTDNNESLKALNDQTYLKLSKIPETASNPKIKKEVERLKAQSDSLNRFIENVKNQLFVEDNGSEKYDVMYLRHKESKKIPQRVMMGKNNDGLAFSLKKNLVLYRDSLTKMTTSDEQKTFLMNSIEIGDVKNQTWEQKTFEHMPLISVINILSNMQNQIRTIEAYMFEVLNQKFLAPASQPVAEENVKVEKAQKGKKGNAALQQAEEVVKQAAKSSKQKPNKKQKAGRQKASKQKATKSVSKKQGKKKRRR